MDRFGMQLLAQIEGWRLSSTGTLTGEKVKQTLRIFRVSDGSVFTKDAGFKLLLGQADEFPLLQVSQMRNLTIQKEDHFQADHISLSPGKKHSVKLFGSHITTSKNPSTWKLDGRLLCIYSAPI